jgi:NAD(P)-dependent dehydrogenase (short-subunit alcohol dehydrogenase family)
MPAHESGPPAGTPATSCVVTGGARGIGRGIAERLVGLGHRVVVTDVDGAAASRTAEEIGAARGLVHDVRDPAAHAAAAQEAARHGVLTAWFNNAGVGDDGMLEELSEEAVRRLVEVNVLGTLWGIRAAVAAFGEAGGDVVNIASLSGLGPVPGYSVYAATKAAIVSASMSVDAETPRRVRVHALCPDGVQTAMLQGQRPDGLGAALVNSGGPILAVDEVAAAAVGLLGSRRVVRSLPGWRGGVVRVGALAPSLTKRGTAVFAAQGRRAIRRRR